MPKYNLSNCCKAPVKTDCADEGTCCYVCSKCNEATDIYVEKYDLKELVKKIMFLSHCDYNEYDAMNNNPAPEEEIEHYIQTKIDQEVKKVLEEIKDKISYFSHYHRSKFSIDCSRGETDEEKRTEMLEEKEIIDLITSYLNK